MEQNIVMDSEQLLTTTKLAEYVRMKRNPFFAMLSEWGWIEKIDGSWKLTQQGITVGGSYKISEYGETIVWRSSVADLEAFKHIEPEYIDDYYEHQQLGKQSFKAGLTWTVEQDAELSTLFKNNKSIPELAKHFSRSEGSIKSRIKKLNLYNQ